jgi:phosphatidylglycerophosphatase A
LAGNRSVVDLGVLWLGQGLGSGRAPLAPGTLGTVPGVGLAWLLGTTGPWTYLVGTALIIVIAVLVAGRSAVLLGRHDHPSIVIDEIAGMLVAMALLPATPLALLTGFCLFRIFDIAKPPPIGLLDRKLGGGIGIVADDVAAGIYANICLQLIAATTGVFN